MNGSRRGRSANRGLLSNSSSEKRDVATLRACSRNSEYLADHLHVPCGEEGQGGLLAGETVVRRGVCCSKRDRLRV